MKPKIVFPFLFVLIILLVLAGCDKSPSKYNTFAQCLTEEGAKMYGAEWCSHCKAQKEAFGSSFQYVAYIDCDKNRDECLRNGVKGYPTWVIDNKIYIGEQKLERLASLTGCDISGG